MGSYKARKNNVEGNTQKEKTPEEIQAQKQKEKKDKESREDVIDAALEVGECIPAAIPYVKAAKAINKFTGGAFTKFASHKINQELKKSDMGDQAQSLMNFASDSGLTDVARNVAKNKNGANGASGANNMPGVIPNSNTGGISSQKSGSSLGGLSKIGGKADSLTDGNIMGKLTSKIPPSIKIKIYIGVAVCFFCTMLFVTVFAEDDEINLGVTNNSTMSEKNDQSSDGSGGSSGDYGENAVNMGDQQTCALTVKDGVYYKTTFPATSSCNVSAFPGNSWGLEPSFYANINALIAAGSAVGCKATIISGHRTYAHQQRLYQKYINQPGRAARPGRSNHEYGIAADLRYSPKNQKCLNFYHSNAKNYGLTYPLLNAKVKEDWHIEPVNIVKGRP